MRHGRKSVTVTKCQPVKVDMITRLSNTHITTLLPLWLTSKTDVEAIAGDVTGTQQARALFRVGEAILISVRTGKDSALFVVANHA